MKYLLIPLLGLALLLGGCGVRESTIAEVRAVHAQLVDSIEQFEQALAHVPDGEFREDLIRSHAEAQALLVQVEERIEELDSSRSWMGLINLAIGAALGAVGIALPYQTKVAKLAKAASAVRDRGKKSKA